jgi:hypothetical protein
LTDQFEKATESVKDLLIQLEADADLLAPQSFERRSDALDLLDAHGLNAHGLAQVSAGGSLAARIDSLRARLESLNSRLYEDLRRQIRAGSGAEALFPWSQIDPGSESSPADGFGYDHLDELIGGVFQFDEPDEESIQRKPETVFYQPTPARHIFRMIGLAGLNAGDVLVDLGAGLGHVAMLARICAGARSVGVELERPYVECAQRSRERLNLDNVEFLCQDARSADLSAGTVFYLHTPFSGSILEDVLSRLRHEASTRPLRLCTFGPCTLAVAEQGWLQADTEPRAEPGADRIALFRSRN